MNRNIEIASEEYVKLVKEVANSNECGQIGKYVEMNVFNMLKLGKEVITVKQTSVPTEVVLDGEDMIDVYIYEPAFDLVDEETRRIWIENALHPVSYDMEKSKVVLNKEPMITVSRGMLGKYKGVIVQKLELAIETLNHIKEKEKEAKAKEKAEKKKNKQ